MKPIKGLYLNSALDDVPEGYTAFCRNGLLNYKDGSVTKERGFADLLQQLPYKYIGRIETADETFLFSTNNVNSAISRFKDDQLTTIIDDKFKVFKFKFNTSNPIKGTAIKNYKNEWIIVWIDTLNPIRVINTITPTVVVEDDLLLFPQYSIPSIVSSVRLGGSVTKGTYIPFIRYSDLDETYTDFIPIGKPVYVGEKINKQTTSKLINFTLSNLDQDYKFYELGFYYIKEGVTTALVTDKRVITANSTYVLSSNAQLDTISVNELLINAPYYKQAQGITQFDDRLVLVNVEEYEEINYQQYANKIRIRCKSNLLDTVVLNQTCSTGTSSSVFSDPGYGSGNIKTFIHDEVYAFYIALVLKSGRKTRAFHIPGRASIPADLGLSTVDNCYKKYQVQNTCKVLDKATGIVELGYWENQDEKYPANFGLTGNVRHHKFPSIDFCKENIYTNNKEYQISTLDQLGILVDNVVIPETLANQIQGYEIYYAKRTFDNQTFLGQSLVLTSSIGLDKKGQPAEKEYFKSTGGNFYVTWAGTTFDLGPNKKNLRLHSFDLEYFKPSINGLLLKNTIKLRNTITIPDYIQRDQVKQIVAIDYTLSKKTVSTALSNAQKYYKVTSSSYLPNNVFTTTNDNRTLESTFIAAIDKEVDIDMSAFFRISDTNIISPLYFETIVTGIFSIKNNLYINFYEQDLVYTGQLNTGLSTEVLYCGDGFIGEYSFVTYGLRETGDLNGAEGNRFVYRFLAESNANLSLRYETEGNIYSKFYPQSDASYLKDLERNFEPNQLGYDRDFGKLYDISKMTAYNPYDVTIVTKHTNRGIISAVESTEKNKRSWKTFFPLDYFEISKSKGEIKDIHSFDRHLFIRTKHSIFTNLDINQLGNDEEIFVKSLNITDQTFVEIFDDEKGVIGTENRFDSYLTPLGLVFVDQKAKNIYTYKQQLKKLNGNLNLFFKNNLTEKGDNPYNGTGYNVCFDPQYNRILFTQKGAKSYTLSYCVDQNIDNWVSFHDYIPDAYIAQRDQLYSIKDNKIYKHNIGSYGRYYDNQVKPFYIDVVLKDTESFVTNNIKWISHTDEEFKTFTHITVYNNYQSTQRIALTQIDWTNFNLRKTKGAFYFDKLKNELTFRKNDFLTDYYLFRQLIQSQFTVKQWYEQEELSSNVVTIRLEDDNSTNSDLVLIDVGVTIQPVVR